MFLFPVKRWAGETLESLLVSSVSCLPSVFCFCWCLLPLDPFQGGPAVLGTIFSLLHSCCLVKALEPFPFLTVFWVVPLSSLCFLTLSSVTGWAAFVLALFSLFTCFARVGSFPGRLSGGLFRLGLLAYLLFVLGCAGRLEVSGFHSLTLHVM